MDAQDLIFEKSNLGGGHTRIWRMRDRGFLFEHIGSTGTSRSVTCPTLEAAHKLMPLRNERT